MTYEEVKSLLMELDVMDSVSLKFGSKHIFIKNSKTDTRCIIDFYRFKDEIKGIDLRKPIDRILHISTDTKDSIVLRRISCIKGTRDEQESKESLRIDIRFRDSTESIKLYI